MNNKSNNSLSSPEQWVSKHGDVLFGFALKYVSDRTIAEDLVQETLLAALKARSRFSGASSEQTWMIGILKNKITDHFRASSKSENIANPDILASSAESDFYQSGPDKGIWVVSRRPAEWMVDATDPAEQDEFWNHLQNCLKGLDQRLARVYVLRDIHEIEYKEVCNTLQVSATNLRVMLYRARGQLRRCLEKNWMETKKGR